MSTTRPPASVVVRTFNSGATLSRCLESIRNQSVLPEIVVVDSGSTDRTLAIAERLADRIVQVPRATFSYGGALNRGAAVAAAPVHFALSSHCVVPRRDWIERSLRHYERSDVAATNGQLKRPDGSPLCDVFLLTRETPLPDPLWGFSNHASSWRADLWRREPFDETLIASEDFEWSDRMLALGFTIVFDPALLVPAYHLRTQGLVAFYRRNRRELLGTAACRRVHAPTLHDTLVEWWSHHPPGTVRHRQRLSPYRLAMLAGRYTAGRTLRAAIGEASRWADSMSACVNVPRPVSSSIGSRPLLPVTVVIPAYNRAAIVGRAVLSARRQVPAEPAEVLVVDDCSTDDTADVARQAGARVVRHPVNRGAGVARNSAIAEASQPWIAFLDSDDEWLPNHLDSLWRERDGHVFLAGAALQCNPHRADRYVGPAQTKGLVARSPAEIATRPSIMASGVLVRRDVAQGVEGFRPLHGVEDIDLWLRVLERGSGYISPVVSLLYHVHPGQLSQDAIRLQEGRREVLESLSDRPWFDPRLLRDWDTTMTWDKARTAQSDGHRALAARLLAEIARDPARVRALLGLLLYRWRTRRRSLRVGRSGKPTLAVVGADPQLRAAASRHAPAFEVVVPRGSTSAGQYAQLARQPATALLTNGFAERALARLLGMRPVRRR